MEGNQQTGEVIFRIRNILAKTVTTDDPIFETCEGEDNAPPTPPTPGSTESLFGEHLPSPSPYPSPSPSPSTRLDQPSGTPVTRRVRDTPPLPSATNQIGETAKGPPGTSKFNRKVPLIADTIDSADSPISESGLLGTPGSPVLDPFAIGEGGCHHGVLLVLLGCPRR
jgi:hypothetical protein